MQAVGLAGMGSQLLGGVAGTIGNVMAADTNAKALDAQARGAVENAQFDETQFRRKAKIEAGSNVATAAASGVDITRGSPLFAQLDFAKQSEIEAQSIRRSGKIAYDNAKFQSRMAKQQIPFDIINGVTGAFGSKPGQPSILTQLAGKY